MIDKFVKQAFETRGNSLRFMKGEKDIELPLGTFLTCCRSLFKGTLRNILVLVTCKEEEDFVEGFDDFVASCVKPLLLSTLDSQLSFVVSASNLQLFAHNYNTAKLFVAEYPEFVDLLSRFNLATFANFVQLEVSDRLVASLQATIEESGQLTAMSNATLSLCQKVLTPASQLTPDDSVGLYLDEVGDRLIKLSVQLVVRHLNFVMDYVNQTRSLLSTERVLCLLSDLHLLQTHCHGTIGPLIAALIAGKMPARGAENCLMPVGHEHL